MLANIFLSRVGTLEGTFARNQFSFSDEKFFDCAAVPSKEMSVREAARLHSVNEGQGVFK